MLLEILENHIENHIFPSVKGRSMNTFYLLHIQPPVAYFFFANNL